MSKAFVKDDEGDDEDEAVEDAPRRGLGRYITRAGHGRLEAELERLWRVDRPRVTDEVATAAAHGDRSENAEYIYGKKKLREIDRRVRFLRKRLEVLQIVDPSPEQRGRVYFGAWVTIEDEEGKEASYRVVGSDEIDLAKKHISIESPLARALLGRAVGEEVLVQRPKGPTEVVITAVRYEG